MCHMGLGGFDINVKTGTESFRNFVFSLYTLFVELFLSF